MKKILCVMLALAMLLALNVSAFAAEINDPVGNVIDFGWVIFAGVVCVVVAVMFVVGFFRKPRDAQIDTLREWLLWAVMQAESYFGAETGTGVLKLRWVYDMFVSKFPWLAKIINFDTFSGLVDEALDRMEQLLTEQPALAPYATHYTFGGTINTDGSEEQE